ncbi:hypothetical protein [Limisalsivibrio acetivorans]|uniref:hypothetical protein n=1 Tax=Limisalsivibrio acetivorans TaxID=1304888 RepID=UPI0003B3A9E3|nr:hypothetical protein [Limisalsivibrio acetivorans]
MRRDIPEKKTPPYSVAPPYILTFNKENFAVHHLGTEEEVIKGALRYPVNFAHLHGTNAVLIASGHLVVFSIIEKRFIYVHNMKRNLSRINAHNGRITGFDGNTFVSVNYIPSLAGKEPVIKTSEVGKPDECAVENSGTDACCSGEWIISDGECPLEIEGVVRTDGFDVFMDNGTITAVGREPVFIKGIRMGGFDKRFCETEKGLHMSEPDGRTSLFHNEKLTEVDSFPDNCTPLEYKDRYVLNEDGDKLYKYAEKVNVGSRHIMMRRENRWGVFYFFEEIMGGE